MQTVRAAKPSETPPGLRSVFSSLKAMIMGTGTSDEDEAQDAPAPLPVPLPKQPALAQALAPVPLPVPLPKAPPPAQVLARAPPPVGLLPTVPVCRPAVATPSGSHVYRPPTLAQAQIDGETTQPQAKKQRSRSSMHSRACKWECFCQSDEQRSDSQNQRGGKRKVCVRECPVEKWRRDPGWPSNPTIPDEPPVGTRCSYLISALPTTGTKEYRGRGSWENV